MTAEPTKDHFIPFRKADIVKMLAADPRLDAAETQPFDDFCRILDAMLHFEFHRQLESLKNCYAPFDPDADTKQYADVAPADKKILIKKLVAELANVLTAANYVKITPEDLKQALTEESLFEIRLMVNFDDFDDVIFFRRGASIRHETIRKFFGLVKKHVQFTNYDRVVVFVKFKDRAYFEAQNRNTLFFEPDSTIIKLFQNIPKSDLEMLFPNSRVRMKTIDKVIIGVPAAISGIIVIVTKLGASLLLVASVLAFWMGLREDEVQIKQQHLIALAAGFGTLGGFLFRQISKFKNRKIKFMKALTDNLYFKNLDNNLGVFHHLIDTAEEEEFKEAILAYYFLLTASGKLTANQLDQKIEKWFKDNWDTEIDFEIGDALHKLERLKIVSREGDGFRCKSPVDAKQTLDGIWDNYFT